MISKEEARIYNYNARNYISGNLENPASLDEKCLTCILIAELSYYIPIYSCLKYIETSMDFLNIGM